MSITKVTIALLAGMAAGVTAGLLFAPQNGAETRDKLSASLTNLADSIKETAGEQIADLVDTVKAKFLEVLKSNFSSRPAEELADDLEHA